MGYLVLFNVMSPDGPYRLDFANREECIVAQILIRLAIDEPGENVKNEYYQGETYETPKSWLQSLPNEGIWELVYNTPPNCARMELRRRLATNLLGWEGVQECHEQVEAVPGADLASVLTSSENQVIRDMFAQYDVDGSGEIDATELRDATLALELHLTGEERFLPSEKELNSMMVAMDKDRNGTVSLEEFTLSISHRIVKLRTVRDKLKNQKELDSYDDAESMGPEAQKAKDDQKEIMMADLEEAMQDIVVETITKYRRVAPPKQKL